MDNKWMYSDMDLFYILQSYVPPPYLLLYIIQGKINDHELFILTESVIRKCNISKFAYANNGLFFLYNLLNIHNYLWFGDRHM